jgi:hypothetical protein
MVNQMTAFDGTVYDLINYQYVNQGAVRRSDNLQFFDPSLPSSGIQSNAPLINFGNYIQNPDWWSKPVSDGGDYNIDPNMTAGYLVRDSEIANYLGDPMSWNHYGVNTPSGIGINRGAIAGISGGRYVMPTSGGYDNTAGWINPNGSIHTEGQDNPEWWQSAILAIASYVSPIGAIIGTVIGDVITGKPINPVQIGVMAVGSLFNAGFPAGETLTDAAVGSSGELINGATGEAIVNSAGSQAVLDGAQQEIVQQAAATAETAAAAGDAYLPGALSNPFLQAMPTLSSMSQAAATNAAMQLATTGKIDPEKVLASIMTSAAGSTAGNLAGNAVGNALDSNLARSIVSGAVNGATQAGINGTDPMAAALASGAASGLGYSAKENGINVPQQVTNALVTSIATGAPLEKTLLSAAMSMGVGAAKDAISGLSSADTQAPAPVETGTPLSPDTSGLDSVNQSDLTQTPAPLPSTTPVETAPNTSGLDSVSTDQGRTGTDALFYDEEGNALDASGDPVYGSHNDVLTDPVTGAVTQPTTQPVTTPVTSTVIPRNTSTTTGGGLSTVAPSSSTQSTQAAQPIPWLTSPNQAGMLTVKKDKNMSLDQMLEQLNPSLSGNTPAYAGGGTITDPFAPLSDALDPKKVSSEFVSAKPTLLAYKKAVASPALSHAPLKNMYQSIARGMAEGGLPSKYEEATPKGHKPEFITGVTGFYADGKGTGQSDDIPALLHDGDYVMDAETVSALGDGSSKAGREVLEKFRNQVPHESKTGGSVIPAKIADGEYVFPAAFVTALGKGENKRGSEILDGLREKLRAHKRKAPLDKIPPKAKSPLEYLKSKV